MSSFAELQALAAERSRIAEERKMVERVKRQQEEKEKKAAAEAMERERAKRQREALIDQDKRRREQIEAKRREAEMKEERTKRLEQERKEALLKKNQQGTDMRKFARASDKAIRRASGGRSSMNGQSRKRDTVQEDEDGFLHGSSGSTLTREEKRQKRQMALLGLGPSTIKKKMSKPQNKAAHNFNGGEFIALGTVKRDRRTIDEIERDLDARKGKVTPSSSGQAAQTLPVLPHVQEKQKLKILEQQRKNAMGLSPADYLPGAPVRADLVAKAKAKETRIKPKPEGSAKKREKVEEPPAIKRRETARDRFLREEEERRRERQKHSSQKYEEDDDESEEEEEEEEDEDEYESEGIDDGPDQSNIRDQIWQIFGRKRSAYMNKDLDESDDDMEADMQSVAREEARSARLARLEDEREEKEQRKREQEKAAKKAARSRRIE
ncbi:SPT2-domain-containing protein [Meira miltonrushii]|uniref:SPT2-domain-containing protein n=1 Tax=Meira miltonrushii TaxID=1280837 RepID=A0A316V589_9BASI|nr:SPT2-domain-containing protein [Meira miltonrushii]PWN32424.1 SPT2-domain-containing protein [Meira miltonrushii]